MKRAELLKYEDTILKVIDSIAWRVRTQIQRCEDEITKAAFKHVLNILEEDKKSLWFSMICKRVFRGTKVGITDLDKILVLNGKTKALVEYKFRQEDFRKVFMVNAFQFMTLRDLSLRSGLPLYYIVEIEEYGDKWFRVLEVDRDLEFKIRRLGNGSSRDSYAVIDLDYTILMDEFEFKAWLRRQYYEL